MAFITFEKYVTDQLDAIREENKELKEMLNDIADRLVTADEGRLTALDERLNANTAALGATVAANQK